MTSILRQRDGEPLMTFLHRIKPELVVGGVAVAVFAPDSRIIIHEFVWTLLVRTSRRSDVITLLFPYVIGCRFVDDGPCSFAITTEDAGIRPTMIVALAATLLQSVAIMAQL